MAGVQLNNILLNDESSPFVNRTIEASDEIQISASLEVQNDVIITGNLQVQGTTTSIESEVSKYADNHLYLNQGYETAAAETGGLVVNYLPIATTDTVAGVFTAGVAATSNPTVVTTGAATFSVGQFIQISTTGEPENCGLFEVLSHAANLLTIRGVGLTATVEDFTQNQFVAETPGAGTITRVNVSVLRAGTDGAWETGLGAVTGISFTDLTAGASTTLQDAYDNDPDGGDATITTNATDGSVVIAGSESLRVTATGGLDVNTLADFDVTTFDVLMTGANGFSIDGTAASNVSVDAGTLTFATTTSGDIDVNSVGDVDIDGVNIQGDATAGISFDAATDSNFTITASTGVAEDLTLSSTNAGAGSGNVLVNADDEIDLTSGALMDFNAGANLDIDVTGTFDMLSTGAMSLDATGASNVSVDNGNLTVSTTTAGNVILNAVGDIDGDAVNVLFDATAGISLDAITDSNFTITGSSAVAEDLTLSSTNAGAGTGNVLVNADDEIDLTSGGLMDMNAGAGLDIDVTGTYDMLSTGVFSIDGTGASNVTATSGNLLLSTVTTGGVNITSVDDSTYTVPSASATAFSLTDGSDTYINVDSTAGLEALDLDTHVNLVEGAGIELTTDAGLVAGNVLSFNTSGNFQLADGDTGTFIDAVPIGISRGTFSSSATAQAFTVPGSLIPVLFGSAPAGASNGRPVFVSSTAGEASLTPPTGSSRVVYVIGYLQGGDGADTTPLVLFQPQFIARGPSVS